MEYNIPICGPLAEKHSLIADYYAAHYDELRAFVAVRLHYAPESEDLVQNIFLRLLQTDRMITPQTLPALVYTVARNLIFDYWRHRRLVEEYEQVVHAGGFGTGSLADAETVYSVSEMMALLEKGIARLTDKQRPIYCMHVYEGKQVSEISRELGIGYKNAEHRLGDARKAVRQYMRRMLA